MTLERVETKIDKMSEILTESILEQAKTNVRHNMSIEENSQQTINLANRQDEIEDTHNKNGPIIAFAAKLQSNMSKIITGLIITIAGSWAVGNMSAQNDQKSEVKKEAKK